MIVKLFAIVLVELVVFMLLKQYKPELAPLSEVAAAVLALLLLAGELKDVRSFFTDTLNASGIGTEYMQILLKALGTALIAQFAANAARDGGQSALAEKIEFGGKLLILAYALPVLKAVLQLITAFSENISE